MRLEQRLLSFFAGARQFFSSYSSYVQAVYTSLAFAPHPSKSFCLLLQKAVFWRSTRKKHDFEEAASVQMILLSNKQALSCKSNILGAVSHQAEGQSGRTTMLKSVKLHFQDIFIKTLSILFSFHMAFYKESYPRGFHYRHCVTKAIAVTVWLPGSDIFCHTCALQSWPFFATKYFFNTRTFSIDATLLKC